MKHKYGSWLVLLFSIGFLSGTQVVFGQSGVKRISMESTTQSLQNGQSISSSSQIFIELPEGKIINISKTPDEFIYISNTLGEAQIYYPKENKVMIERNDLFSSKNHSLYYFLTNRTMDMGLQELKFRQLSSRKEGDYVITTWQAPLNLLSRVDQVDLVFEDFHPVYLEYRNTKKEITLKIYYSDFQPVYESMIPGTITEIIFSSKQDSIIRRTRFNDIQTGVHVNTTGFMFKIPEDAKVVK